MPGAVGAGETVLFWGKVWWRNVPVKVDFYGQKYNIVMFPAIWNILQTQEYKEFRTKILKADQPSKTHYANLPSELAPAPATVSPDAEEPREEAAIRKVKPQDNLKNIIMFQDIHTMRDFWGFWVENKHRYSEKKAGKQEKSLTEEKSKAQALGAFIKWKAQELGDGDAVAFAQHVKNQVDGLAGRTIPMGSFCDAVRAILYAGGVVQPKRKGKSANCSTAKINRTDVLYAQVAGCMGVEVPGSK